MADKKFCDVCGAEMPTSEQVATMPHNEAANTRWGKWFFQSGVLAIEFDDLCQDCGLKVTAFINRLKDEQRVREQEEQVRKEAAPIADSFSISPELLDKLWEQKNPLLLSWVRTKVDKVGT